MKDFLIKLSEMFQLGAENLHNKEITITLMNVWFCHTCLEIHAIYVISTVWKPGPVVHWSHVHFSGWSSWVQSQPRHFRQSRIRGRIPEQGLLKIHKGNNWKDSWGDSWENFKGFLKEFQKKSLCWKLKLEILEKFEEFQKKILNQIPKKIEKIIGKFLKEFLVQLVENSWVNTYLNLLFFFVFLFKNFL